MMARASCLAASFPRRLIAERKIRFVRVGRCVRIPECASAEFIAAGTVQPVTAWAHRRRRVSYVSGRKTRSFGSLCRLPSGRWQARYRGPDGLLVSEPGTFVRKTDGARWLALTEAELLKDDWIDPEAGRVPLIDYADAWIAERPGLRPKTIQLYRYLLRRHLAPRFTTIGSITEANVRRWRADLIDDGVSPVTAAKAYRLLKSILATAVEDSLIRRKPVPGQGCRKRAVTRAAAAHRR